MHVRPLQGVFFRRGVDLTQQTLPKGPDYFCVVNVPAAIAATQAASPPGQRRTSGFGGGYEVYEGYENGYELGEW